MKPLSWWPAAVISVLMAALSVFPAGASGPLPNSQPDFAAIDAYITSRMAALHIPGVSLAIVSGDQMVYQQGYGAADPAGRPMTPQTPLLIGSVSKSFTATAVMQLVEAGLLDLDIPVQQYLPWFSVLPPPKSAYTDLELAPDPLAASRITVRQLLSHTSGFSRSSGEKFMASRDTSAAALENQVRAFSREKLQQPPGSGFEYSNANFITLGLLVQTVSGLPYETYIQQHIFEPLGMVNSFTSQDMALARGMATGCRRIYGLPLLSGELPYPRAMLPAGYLISSAEDLGHYLIAQLNHGRYQEAEILSPAGMQVLHTPAVAAAPGGYHQLPGADYAMGWYVMQMNGIPVITHDGDTPAVHADVFLLPESQLGVALLVNSNTVLMGDGIRGLAGGVVSLLAGQQPPKGQSDFMALFFYTVMSVVLVFEVYRFIRLLSAARPAKTVPPRQTPRLRFKRLILPLLIGGMAAVFMFVGMPLMFSVPWRVMLLNQPDLAWVILISGSLALINGGLQSLRNGRRSSG